MPTCDDQYGTFADFDVVRDLDEVVNLRALADDRRAERAAVNRHVRADFHVVADDDVADLRHLAVNAAVQHVTESVRADHRAGMDADALADFRARINRDVREQIHLVAELGIVADGNCRPAKQIRRRSSRARRRRNAARCAPSGPLWRWAATTAVG